MTEGLAKTFTSCIDRDDDLVPEATCGQGGGYMSPRGLLFGNHEVYFTPRARLNAHALFPSSWLRKNRPLIRAFP